MKYPTPGKIYAEGDRLTIGPFLFEQRRSGRDECWDIVRDRELLATHFSLKNYGPGEGTWSGWNIVSGGPFIRFGHSREEAFEKGVPWLIEYYRKDARQRAAKAKRTLELLEQFLGQMELAEA